MKKVVFSIIVLFLININFTFADIYSEDNLYGQPVTNITHITLYENVTNYWDALDTPADIDGSLYNWVNFWNRSGTNVFLHHTGDNVGIGNTDPNSTLHVSGDIRISQGNRIKLDDGEVGFEMPVAGQIEVMGTSVDTTGLILRPNNKQIHFGATTSAPYIYAPSTTSLRASHTFQVGTTFIANTTSGNVGIGTNTPSSKLDVAGNLEVDGTITTGIEEGLRLETQGTPFSLHTASGVFNGVRDDVSYWAYNLLPGGVSTKINASEPFLKFSIEANYFDTVHNYMEYNLDYLSADDSTAMRTLGHTIDRATHETGWKFISKGGLTGQGYFSIAGDATEHQFQFWPNNSTRRIMLRFAGGPKDLLQIGYDGGASAPTAIMIGPSALTASELNIYTDKITTSSSVNVGIGTTSPTHELNVIGDGNFTGTIYANAINISNSSFSFTHNENSPIKYSIQNQNSGSNATSLITTLNDVGGLLGIGIGSSNYILGNMLMPNMTALFSRSQGEMAFINTFNQPFIWYNNPSDDNNLSNLVKIMRLDENGLNLSGNFSGNQFYAEMWFHNDSANGNPTVISAQDVWYNVTGFNQATESGQSLNGFTFSDHKITCQISGLYKIDYSISFGGGLNDEYKTAVGVNGVKQSNTETHRKLGAGGDVGNTGSGGFVSLNTNDEITLMILNDDAIANADVHSANINLIRIGDG